MCLSLPVSHFHQDKTITETFTFLSIAHIKSSSPDLLSRQKKLDLLTKFLKAQQSRPIQVFGLKII